MLSLSLQEGRTALSLASWKGHTEIVGILIQRGASMDTQDEVTLHTITYMYMVVPSFTGVATDKACH